MKFALPILFAVLASTSAHAASCTPAHQFKTVTPGVLTVAVVTYMPYAAIATDGSPTGVEGEILKKIASRECLSVKTVPVDSAASMNYVISGRADLTSGGYYRTAARAKVVDLSDPLYIDQMAIVSKEGWSNFDQLKGKTIGVIQGDLWVADLQRVYASGLKPYPALAQLIQDTDAGRLDALITGFSTAKTAQDSGQLQGLKIAPAQKDERIGASVNAGQGCFPMSKRDEGLLAAFNADIADMHRDGTIKAALEQYHLDPSAAEAGEPRLLN